MQQSVPHAQQPQQPQEHLPPETQIVQVCRKFRRGRGRGGGKRVCRHVGGGGVNGGANDFGVVRVAERERRRVSGRRRRERLAAVDRVVQQQVTEAAVERLNGREPPERGSPKCGGGPEQRKKKKSTKH